MNDAHFNVLGMIDDPDAPTKISRRWTVGSTAQAYGLDHFEELMDRFGIKLEQ